MNIFPFYECASGCGCTEDDNKVYPDSHGNHPGAACVFEKWNRRVFQCWLNPSWSVWGVFMSYPRGLNIRFGRIVIQLFGEGGRIYD